MDVKVLIKQLTPPILLDLYRRVRGRHIWNGVYDSYASVPSTGDGFNGDNYVQARLAYANQIIESASRCRGVPTEVFGDDALLPLLASVVLQRNSERLRILDFGGGLGTGYLHLRSSAPSLVDVEYHVVELEWACREGARLFPGNGQIIFHRALPERLPELDIVYSSGALMYIEGYPDVLSKLCAYRARYLLLVNVAAGVFPTFASAQRNIDRTIIPHWFFNFNEIVRRIEAERYSLVFKSAVETGLKQDNFPTEYRLDAGRACALLFKNADA